MAEIQNINYSNLAHKSIIITGGASGLGLATATRFAEHGAYVTLADVQDDLGHKHTADLSSKGYKVTYVHCDTTSWSSSVAAFKHAVNFSPRKTLDAAALFAGIGGTGGNFITNIADNDTPSLDHDPTEPSSRVVDVNLDGVIKSTQLALHYFRLPASTSSDPPHPPTKKKNLILCASLAGYIDYPASEYCISKFGVRGLFRSLRAITTKNPDTNVTVNVVCPGYTPTAMTLGGPRTGHEFFKFIEENGMWSPVEYVVQYACLCATDDAVNGRSFATLPAGLFDLEEDLDKGYAGEKLAELLKSSRYVEFKFV